MKNKTKICICISVLILCCLLIVLYSCYGFTDIQISEYCFEANVSEPVRIVQLTDLHNSEFGNNNDELIQSAAQLNPDIIVLTGDMINRDEQNTDTVCSLISGLSEIAAVYYGYGNHETDWEELWNADLSERLENAGAVVLNNAYTDVQINGTTFRIGGYMGYYRQPGMLVDDEAQCEADLRFADDFENTDTIKILLNHIPTQWVDWNYIDKYDVDYVFCGHYHGGIVRIPFIDRGLYAPYAGWFPKYTKGAFSGSEATCILSAGLGSEHIIPRLNNPPEIVVVDMVP